jgi:hypothetical protein
MRRSRFPMKQQPATAVGDVTARHIVTDAGTAGSAQRGSEVSRLLLVRLREAARNRRALLLRSDR